MTYATQTEIMNAVRQFGNVGRDSVTGMYSVDSEGNKVRHGRKLYRDSLANTARENGLKLEGWLYVTK